MSQPIVESSRKQSVPPIRTTPWAYASVVCSLGIFCPVMTLIGPLLGVKALAEIRARPGATGTGLATTGIVIGMVMTAVWVAAIVYWDRAIRSPLIQGPVPELRAGLQGDVDRFLQGFYLPENEQARSEAESFLSELSTRYGMVQRVVQDDTREPIETEWGAISPIVPYLMEFERAFVGGEAEFVILDQRRRGIIAKWRWIIIRDPERGDMVFPSRAEDLRQHALDAVHGERAPGEHQQD